MRRPGLWGCALLAATACGGDETNDTDNDNDHEIPAVTRAEVIESYADIVHMSYVDAHGRAVALRDAVQTFVDDPTPGKLEYAKRAWLDARIPYGQTEAYRFYGGPIDGDDGPEGQLNAWPLDEAYVDYVAGDEDAGIINDATIDISKAELASLNEGGMGDVTGIGAGFDGEKAISTGYHAIEFLLWGQDLEDGGPGSRPATDFAADGRANADRRGLYLIAVTELLVDDLATLVDAWAPAGNNYRAEFLALPEDEALAAMLTGIGVLSKGELAAERMDVALDTLDQEDEHSCFSDNTHNDILLNAIGIQNVYLGRYGLHDGPGVDALVRQADPALDERMRAELQASIDAVLEIPVPFDQAIATQGSAGWNAVDAAIDALFSQADTLVEVGGALGIEVGVDLPE